MTDAAYCREKFIEENLGLVHSLCRRFTGRGIEYDDLYQAGCIGLIKAADGFDRSRGLCFSTYAVPVILGEIKRLFRDGGAVKVSRSLKELALKISRISPQLEAALGREPTLSEIATALGASPEEISEAVCAAQPVISLTCENDGSPSELDLPIPGPEDELTERVAVAGALSRLHTEEQQLIAYRYFHGLTQSRTAQLLGISQVQVSRTEKRLLKRLREILDGEPP